MLAAVISRMSDADRTRVLESVVWHASPATLRMLADEVSITEPTSGPVRFNR
jgi:hypothetical protein